MGDLKLHQKPSDKYDVIEYQDFHISHWHAVGDLPSKKSTSIILGDLNVFLKLSGTHKVLDSIAKEKGIVGCIDYLIDNIDQTHYTSDLRKFVLFPDMDKNHKKMVSIIGKDNFDRLSNAYLSLGT